MTRILIVDDHPLFMNGISAVLELHLKDATIFKAGSATEVNVIINNIADSNATFDWAFLDYFLPDCNGIELMKLLRRRFPCTRFVLTSGNERVEMVSDALDQGALGFIAKSGAPKDVFNCIDTITAGDIYLAPEMVLQLGYYRSNVKGEKKRIAHQISKRQKEVLLLLSAGYSNAEIASALGISPHTVKDHVSNIMQLLDADNRVHCITEARQMGLIS